MVSGTACTSKSEDEDSVSPPPTSPTPTTSVEELSINGNADLGRYDKNWNNSTPALHLNTNPVLNSLENPDIKVLGLDGDLFEVRDYDRGKGVFFKEAPSTSLPDDSNKDNIYEFLVDIRAASTAAASKLFKITVVGSDEIVEPPAPNNPNNLGVPTILGGTERNFNVQTAAAKSISERRIVDRIVAQFFDLTDIAYNLLSAGVDSHLFSIDAQGVLSWSTFPDPSSPADANNDNVYEITIGVFGPGKQATKNLNITVSNSTTTPTIVDPAPPSVGGLTILGIANLGHYVENTTTPVLMLETSPAYDTLTNPVNNILGLDANVFEFRNNGNGQAIYFKNSPTVTNPMDSNRDNVYEFLLDVSASGGKSANKTFTVTVTRAVITPPAILGDTERNFNVLTAAEKPVSERRIVDTIVTNFFDLTNIAFNLLSTGADSRLFIIDSEGVLSWKTFPDLNSPTDANTDNVYEITVNVSGPGKQATRNLNIRVSNSTPTVEPVPPTVGGLTILGASNLGNYVERSTTPVLILETSPAYDTLTKPEINIVGLDASKFEFRILGNSWALFFRDIRSRFGNTSPRFSDPGDSNRDNVYEFLLDVSASGGKSANKAFTVTVIQAVVTPPSVTTGGPLTIINNDAELEHNIQKVAQRLTKDRKAVVTVLTNSSPQTPVSYALLSSGADSDLFTISSSGAISWIALPDFDTPGDADGNNRYEVVVSASAGGEHNAQHKYVVVVNDQAPTAIPKVGSDVEELLQVDSPLVLVANAPTVPNQQIVYYGGPNGFNSLLSENYWYYVARANRAIRWPSSFNTHDIEQNNLSEIFITTSNPDYILKDISANDAVLVPVGDLSVTTNPPSPLFERNISNVVRDTESSGGYSYTVANPSYRLNREIDKLNRVMSGLDAGRVAYVYGTVINSKGVVSKHIGSRGCDIDLIAQGCIGIDHEATLKDGTILSGTSYGVFRMAPILDFFIRTYELNALQAIALVKATAIGGEISGGTLPGWGKANYAGVYQRDSNGNIMRDANNKIPLLNKADVLALIEAVPARFNTWLSSQ